MTILCCVIQNFLGAVTKFLSPLRKVNSRLGFVDSFLLFAMAAAELVSLKEVQLIRLPQYAVLAFLC